MLTPAFELRQEPDYLIIIIKAPFAKISETEIYIEDYEFKFYSKPYYLRLNLPGAIVEDGRECADYDSDTGTFTVRAPKVNPGEHFEGLDMLTKLLAPIGHSSPKQPNIEVLDNEADESLPLDDVIKDQDEEEEFDWQTEQTPYEESEVSLEAPRYGFANRRSGVFHRLQSELSEVIDLKTADSVPWWQRRELRIADEQDKFDDDHYLADFYQDETIRQLLEFQPVWVEEYKQIHSGACAEDVVLITKEEREQMRNLPRKEYVLDEKEQHAAFLSLVDIIFAYAFNHRTTEGDNTVESSWTVCKLSGTLSWLETYRSLKDAVITSYRRGLCYPLYRHWKLTNKVFRDVQKIFLIGRHRLLKCLLEVHSMLIDCDARYVLNDLYIADYCVWIQDVSSKQLKSLARNLAKVKIKKRDVGLDLVVLEQAGALAVQEEEAANEITAQVAAMTVQASASSPQSSAETSNISIDSPGNPCSENPCSENPCSESAETFQSVETRPDSDTEKKPDDLDLCSSTDSETSDSSSVSTSGDSDSDTDDDDDDIDDDTSSSDADTLKVESPPDEQSCESATAVVGPDSDSTDVQPKILDPDLKDAEGAKCAAEKDVPKNPSENPSNKTDTKSLNF